MHGVSLPGRETMGPEEEENWKLEIGVELLGSKGICHLSFKGTQPGPPLDHVGSSYELKIMPLWEDQLGRHTRGIQMAPLHEEKTASSSSRCSPQQDSQLVNKT